MNIIDDSFKYLKSKINFDLINAKASQSVSKLWKEIEEKNPSIVNSDFNLKEHINDVLDSQIEIAIIKDIQNLVYEIFASQEKYIWLTQIDKAINNTDGYGSVCFKIPKNLNSNKSRKIFLDKIAKFYTENEYDMVLFNILYLPQVILSAFSSDLMNSKNLAESWENRFYKEKKKRPHKYDLKTTDRAIEIYNNNKGKRPRITIADAIVSANNETKAVNPDLLRINGLDLPLLSGWVDSIKHKK